MPDTTREAPRARALQQPLYKRLLWMAAIWGASVAALGLVAAAIRLLLEP